MKNIKLSLIAISILSSAGLCAFQSHADTIGVPNDPKLPAYLVTRDCGTDNAVASLYAGNKIKFIAMNSALYIAFAGDFMKDGTLAVDYALPVEDKVEHNLGERETETIGRYLNAEKTEYSYVVRDTDGELISSIDFRISNSKVVVSYLSNQGNGATKTCELQRVQE